MHGIFGLEFFGLESATVGDERRLSATVGDDRRQSTTIGDYRNVHERKRSKKVHLSASIISFVNGFGWVQAICRLKISPVYYTHAQMVKEHAFMNQFKGCLLTSIYLLLMLASLTWPDSISIR